MSKRFALVWRVFGCVLIAVTLLAVVCLYTNYALFFSLYCGVCCLLLPPVATAIRKRSERVYRVSRVIFLTLFFAFVAYFAFASTLMGVTIASATPPTGCDVVILGSGIRGDQPDIMLKDRLDTAAAYLLENPDSRAICCGGTDPRNELSEAEVMRRYLVKKGVDNDRILLDEQSTSTEENIRFAVALMGDEDRPITICSSNFHLYRAKMFARKEGLGEVSLMDAPTPSMLFPAFWFREVFGISRMWLLGY